mmetsp:Transcript_42576/g.69222  ORF Transcript_42576/g.69222 Transcript_42576/m.69222 type:complete len:88 (-) Transcript_42576:563-826(-)
MELFWHGRGGIYGGQMIGEIQLSTRTLGKRLILILILRPLGKEKIQACGSIPGLMKSTHIYSALKSQTYASNKKKSQKIIKMRTIFF